MNNWRSNKIVFCKPPLPLVVLVFLLVLLVVCSCSKSLTKLRVFAAAGAKPAIDECVKMFEEKYGAKVEINYGGGGEILSKMEITKSGDIYIAPEQRFMILAEDKGAIEPETVKVIAYMIPVIAVQKGNPKNIRALSDLTGKRIRVAITRPETTLLGKYAPEIFLKAGLANAVKKNIVTHAARPDNIVMMLSTKHVDAGIIWHFYQFHAPDEIENIFLSAEQLTGIGEMQIAVSKYSRSKKSALRFVDFVASSNGKAIFKKHGYIVDTDALKKYWH